MKETIKIILVDDEVLFRKGISFLLSKEKNIEVEVRDIYIDEIVEAYKKGVLKEAFGSGTAAVVSHIAEITHGTTKMILPEEHVMSNMLRDEINGLRSGRIEDKRHWLVPVEVNIKQIQYE